MALHLLQGAALLEPRLHAAAVDGEDGGPRRLRRTPPA
eukprot:CAMPEP_0118887896 /NCGR_PEP_ID=MMETSP1163-20130328/25434_1 /TAXON_ID=124430 /ORGANISM="Phaeomonas parva, Strain CCMP2877" /LENGTH=37 /DNA_ID= /DNA_START= /DNA_END= /DNA_ORIENTATION=